MNKQAVLILGIVALTISSIGIAYAVLFTATVNVTVTHTPTPASITLTNPPPPHTISATIASGLTTTKTLTLHNSGEANGSATLTISVNLSDPVLPVSFNASGPPQLTKTVSVPGGGNTDVTVYIGPAPSSPVDLSYIITVTAS